MPVIRGLGGYFASPSKKKIDGQVASNDKPIAPIGPIGPSNKPVVSSGNKRYQKYKKFVKSKTKRPVDKLKDYIEGKKRIIRKL
jgi:hypothetical protein